MRLYQIWSEFYTKGGSGIDIIFKQRMEDPLQLVPVTALVPVAGVRPVDVLAKKYWHIICKALFVLPCGLQFLRVSLFLVSFDGRLFLNIALEVVAALPPMQHDIGCPQYPPLAEREEGALMLLHGAIPLACASFELPSCARCFLGYSCNSHH